MNRTEHARRLDNVLRLGTISELDLANATARVKSGEIETDFLPWLTLRAGTTKTWSPPTIGEQVLILAVSGEFNTGVILPAVYTNNAPSQSADEFLMAFPDGAMLKYDHASGQFSLTGCKSVEINASESMTVNCPNVSFSSNVTIGGALKVQGAISTSADISANGDISSGDINLRTHHHMEQGDNRPTSTAR